MQPIRLIFLAYRIECMVGLRWKCNHSILRHSAKCVVKNSCMTIIIYIDIIDIVRTFSFPRRKPPYSENNKRYNTLKFFGQKVHSSKYSTHYLCFLKNTYLKNKPSCVLNNFSDSYLLFPSLYHSLFSTSIKKYAKTYLIAI